MSSPEPSPKHNLVYRQLALGSPEHTAALELRYEVLRKPLPTTVPHVVPEDEARSYHLGCFIPGEASETLVGVLMLTPIDSTTIKMRQVAVDPSYRGLGIGAQLVSYAEEFARLAGYTIMTAHARAVVIEFYRRLGYTIGEDMFIEVTIPHFHISKKLVP